MSTDDFPQLQTFDSLKNAMQAVNEFEECTTSNYIVIEKQKNFENEAFTPTSKVTVHWEGPVLNDICLLDYSGVPFIIVGRKVLLCHLGKDRAVAQKRKYAERVIKKQKTDHPFLSQRKLVQHTKKMDCPAKIYIYHVLKFQDFEIKKKTKWQMKAASKKLRSALEENVNFNHSYIIIFPQLSHHKNHPLDGEAAQIREKVDPRVVKKISDLFKSGISRKQDIKRLVSHFVRHVLFFGQDLPVNSRRRYFPTLKDIENIMRRCTEERKSSVMDQNTVLQLFDLWTKENPKYHLYCRPHKVNEEDKQVENFMLCYQTDWQQKLLVKYGNAITLLDATYRTTRYALPLFFLCVRTNVCYTVVGAFVVQQETSHSIEEALQIFRMWNEDWSPTCFMVDFCLEEINAIS